MRKLLAQLAAGSLLLLAACSSEPASGPGKLVWDRDLCERCSMAIGDRRFAVQLRDAGDGRLHRFDDIGCALLWLDEREVTPAADSKSSPPELWVRDPAGERWIDGLTARFAAGFETPMGYGFGTVEQDAPESLELTQVHSRLRASEDERRSHER